MTIITTTRLEYQAIGEEIASGVPGIWKYRCPLCRGRKEIPDPHDRAAHDECSGCLGYGFLFAFRGTTPVVTVEEFVDTNRWRLTSQTPPLPTGGTGLAPGGPGGSETHAERP